MSDASHSIAVPSATAPVRAGKRNTPLAFTLKSIDAQHPRLDSLGLARETLELFGVGYFVGKGIMHHKVVIPIQDADGELVAYAGYDPATGTYSYPNGFDPSLEVYNASRCARAGAIGDRIVIVTDLLNVLRLHELGVDRVVALPTETLCAPQLALITKLVGVGGLIDYAPWTKEYIDTLATLLSRFHVRLHRYDLGSEDEFLRQVAYSLGW